MSSGLPRIVYSWWYLWWYDAWCYDAWCYDAWWIDAFDWGNLCQILLEVSRGQLCYFASMITSLVWLNGRKRRKLGWGTACASGKRLGSRTLSLVSSSSFHVSCKAPPFVCLTELCVATCLPSSCGKSTRSPLLTLGLFTKNCKIRSPWEDYQHACIQCGV